MSKVINKNLGEPYDVSIGPDSSLWANREFHFLQPKGGDGTSENAQCVQAYELFLLNNPRLRELAKLELKNKVLGCFCAPPGGLTTANTPFTCHGQWLLKVVEGGFG